MTESLSPLVAETFSRLAAQLESAPPEIWGTPSLCEGWRTREVVAHVTMPARMTPEEVAAGVAGAGGDFTAFSDAVAARDADLPVAEHLANLRSARLAEWEPGVGGALGALNHAVVHSLDVTLPAGLERSCPDAAAVAVLDGMCSAGFARFFDVDVSGLRLEATDLDWSFGDGVRHVVAPVGDLIALLAHRTLPAVDPLA